MGKRMRTLRAATGMTQPGLSKLIDDLGLYAVSIRQVATMERGDGGASMRSWHAVSEALGVPLASFLKDAETSASAAAERPVKYQTGNHATDEQLEALMKAASHLSAKTVRSLLDLALESRPVKKR
jgi:transcriptional regulator with XRE-family HTH domain